MINIINKFNKPQQFKSLFQNIKLRWFSSILSIRMVKSNNYKIIIIILVFSELQLALSIWNESERQFSDTTNQTLKLFYCLPNGIIPFQIQLVLLGFYWVFMLFLIFKHSQKNSHTIWLKLFAEIVYLHNCIFYYYINYILWIVIFQEQQYLQINISQELRTFITILCYVILIMNITLAIISDRFYFQENNSGPLSTHRSKKSLIILLLKLFHSFFIKTKIALWMVYFFIIITCLLTIFLIIFRTIYYNMQILKLKLIILILLIFITIHAFGDQFDYHINWLLAAIIISFASKVLFLMLDMNFKRLYQKTIMELESPFDCISQFYIIQDTLKNCLGFASNLRDRYEEEIYFKGTLRILHNNNHIDSLEMITNPEKYAIWLLKEYIQKFPRSFSLRVLAMNYFIKINEASQQAIFLVGDIENNSNLDILGQLELFKMKSMLKTHFAFNQKTDAIQIKQWIAYRESITSFRISLIMHAKEIKEFWTILQKNSIILNDLIIQSMKISKYEHLVKNQWENLSHFDHKKPTFTYALYAMYNLIGLNSSKAAQELLHFYKSFTKQEVLNEMRINFDNKDFFSLDVIYLIVSAQKYNSGKILSCSDNVPNILGYSKKELLNHDIQIVIPRIYGTNHYQYMRKPMDLKDISIAHQAFDIFYINNKNRNSPCSLNIILDTHVEYGLCFLILLKRNFHNGSYILMDDKGIIDSISRDPLFEANHLPVHINQICPEFSKIQEAFNNVRDNLSLIREMSMGQSIKNNLIQEYVEIYKRYTNGDILDFRINKDNDSQSNQSSTRPNEKLERFWCVIKDNFIKQANSNDTKVVRILHLILLSQTEKEYLVSKKTTILKHLSVENSLSLEDEIIESIKDFQGFDEDSKMGFAQIPLCSPERSKLIEIDYKDKKLLEINSRETSGIFSNSSPKHILSPKIGLNSLRKNLSDSISNLRNEKNQKISKFLQNSKKSFNLTKDLANKLMPVQEDSHHDGIVDLETDGEHKLNLSDSKKRDIEIRQAIRNQIIYNPSPNESSISTNISKLIRDMVSKNYTSKNINQIKYFLVITFLLQISLTILTHIMQSNSIDQMGIDLIAIQYNTQRFDNLVEINRRARAIYLINENYMSNTRHSAEGVPDYRARLQGSIYITAISLKQVSDSLREYAGKYLSDISYDCLVSEITMNWNNTGFNYTYQELNVFDAINVVVSESIKIANSSYMYTKQDIRRQIKFLLSNTLDDVANQLADDSIDFQNAVLKAILNINSVQYIICSVSISNIIVGIIIGLTRQYKLKAKKEEILFLFIKLRNYEIEILIKRIDLLINFLQLNNIHNNNIDKILNEVKNYENDLDGNIEHKKISKTTNVKKIHFELYKQTTKIIFIFLIMIAFYITQIILFTNFTNLCTNESNMISKTYIALINQGLAFTLIYQYVQTNGSSIVMGKNISDIIEEKIKITEQQLDFISSYYVDESIINQANEILLGDVCKNQISNTFCLGIGNGAGQRGLIGLNTWMSGVLSSIYQDFITSNRTKSMAVAVLSRQSLIELEAGYSLLIRELYISLSDILMTYFEKNSESMAEILVNMTIGFLIIVPIVFICIILRTISQVNNIALKSRKMLRLVPDLLYVKNINFKRYLMKEANLKGTIYNF